MITVGRSKIGIVKDLGTLTNTIIVLFLMDKIPLHFFKSLKIPLYTSWHFSLTVSLEYSRFK